MMMMMVMMMTTMTMMAIDGANERAQGEIYTRWMYYESTSINQVCITDRQERQERTCLPGYTM
jgi:hypothetical protein